jgi:predicted metal-dependent HD superfamily phosphohydrolase
VIGLDRKRWNNLCHGASNEGAAWYERLVDLYSQPHRHYHNCQHIADCLHEFDLSRDISVAPLAVELAIWFHDAIYNPRAADNEEQSAELAKEFVTETGVGKEVGSAVVQLVLATKHHDGSLHRDAVLMVDIDLGVFGQLPERFWEYEQDIRKEYEWVPERLFASKRAEILERFLSRDRIFHTEVFYNKYEAQARVNLTESVRRLRTG